MPDYITTAIIKTADNVAANYATNTYHFHADDLTALQLAHNALVTFYQAIDTNFSDMVNAGAGGLEVVSWDFDDTPPRAPVLRTLATLAGFSINGLPPEVAICVSFQGTRLSGVPQARRRGRVYIPFLQETANDSTGRPASALITSLATAAGALLTASDSAATWAWEIWSAAGPGFTTVTDGWVDNEWDTQRRRGRVATSRTTFT
jgi:hypothetical protein